MMSRETTYQGTLEDLERLNAALLANAADLPQLDGVRVELEQLLNLARETLEEQTGLIAGKLDATRRLIRLIGNGRRVATATRKLLKAHYGLSSEKLAEFGVEPFLGRGRRTSPGIAPSGAAESAEPINPKS